MSNSYALLCAGSAIVKVIVSVVFAFSCRNAVLSLLDYSPRAAISDLPTTPLIPLWVLDILQSHPLPFAMPTLSHSHATAVSHYN
eukprot:IDg6764t1